MKNCIECEREIPKRRIEILPKTKICVECQHEEERTGSFKRTKMGHIIRYRGDEIESMDSYLVQGTV